MGIKIQPGAKCVFERDDVEQGQNCNEIIVNWYYISYAYVRVRILIRTHIFPLCFLYFDFSRLSAKRKSERGKFSVWVLSRSTCRKWLKSVFRFFRLLKVHWPKKIVHLKCINRFNRVWLIAVKRRFLFFECFMILSSCHVIGFFFLVCGPIESMLHFKRQLRL